MAALRACRRAHTAEQTCKCRTVTACRRREVSEERRPVLGLLLNIVEPVVEFRKAECPVDLRSGELEAVFREGNPLFAVGISRNTCSGR